MEASDSSATALLLRQLKGWEGISPGRMSSQPFPAFSQSLSSLGQQFQELSPDPDPELLGSVKSTLSSDDALEGPPSAGLSISSSLEEEVDTEGQGSDGPLAPLMFYNVEFAETPRGLARHGSGWKYTRSAIEARSQGRHHGSESPEVSASGGSAMNLGPALQRSIELVSLQGGQGVKDPGAELEGLSDRLAPVTSLGSKEASQISGELRKGRTRAVQFKYEVFTGRSSFDRGFLHDSESTQGLGTDRDSSTDRPFEQEGTAMSSVGAMKGVSVKRGSPLSSKDNPSLQMAKLLSQAARLVADYTDSLQQYKMVQVELLDELKGMMAAFYLPELT